MCLQKNPQIIKGATCAYGLKKIYDWYKGPCIRVVRSSDNAEADIYFNAYGDLDWLYLMLFAGNSTVFVKIWYDQSGNNNHATQTDITKMPTIVNSGSLIRGSNGKPGIKGRNNNSSDFAFLNTATGFPINKAQSFSIFIVGGNSSKAGGLMTINNSAGTLNWGNLLNYTRADYTPYYRIRFDLSVATSGYFGWGTNLNSNYGQFAYIGTYDGSNIVLDFYNKDISGGKRSSGSVAWTLAADNNRALYLFSRNVTSYAESFDGIIQEYIMYDRALTDGERIQNSFNQDSYYKTKII
jgi:hypothetical protein